MCAERNFYEKHQYTIAGKKVLVYPSIEADRSRHHQNLLETSACGQTLYRKIGFTPMTDYLKLDKTEK